MLVSIKATMAAYGRALGAPRVDGKAGCGGVYDGVVMRAVVK